jgi:serine/threonine protein kinase
MNGGINKSKQELKLDLEDRNNQQLEDILKQSCRFFGQKEKQRTSKLYNRNGLQILEEDVQFLKHNDIFYLALDGEDFNNLNILDEYELGDVIGEGGFGKVILGKQLATKRKVAIKFMDISE